MNTLLVSCVLPWLLNILILDPYYNWSREKAVKSAKIHKDAKKYSKGPVFKLTGKYAA